MTLCVTSVFFTFGGRRSVPFGGGKCNFISSQMRRKEKESSAYFNIPLTTVRFTVV
jgi:hypothetical protein